MREDRRDVLRPEGVRLQEADQVRRVALACLAPRRCLQLRPLLRRVLLWPAAAELLHPRLQCLGVCLGTLRLACHSTHSKSVHLRASVQ
eukprot:7388959-Prymnesium_polylepis.1